MLGCILENIYRKEVDKMSFRFLIIVLVNIEEWY